MTDNNNNTQLISDMDDGLFQGSWHATKPHILNKYNIDTVICIGFKPDKLADHVNYTYVDVDDTAQNTNYIFNTLLPTYLPYIYNNNNNNNILIACSAGKSRSIIFVLVYLITYRNMSLQKALEFVKSRRPCANPNPMFIYELKRRYK